MASQNLGVEDLELRGYLNVLYVVLNVVVAIILVVGLMFTILLYEIFVNDLSMDSFVTWYLKSTSPEKHRSR